MNLTCRIETGAQIMRTRMSAKARLTRNKLTTFWRLRQVATDKITYSVEGLRCFFTIGFKKKQELHL